MELRPYLPSAKFTVMVGSLVLSVGLVLAAQYVTRPHVPAMLGATNTPAPSDDWQQSLSDVVAQSGIEAPQAPDPATVESLLAQAHTSNLTDEVGRSILINLSSQNAQGLGQDAPTQDQLVAQAAAQINASASSTVYTQSDISIAPAGSAALHAYGNALVAAMEAHPEASAQAAYLAIGQAADTGSPSSLASLSSIGAAYAAIASDLADTPVPQTLSPLHLKLINDYAAMAATFPDMGKLLSDPLRGMAAVQRYAALMNEASRVLTSIAEALNKDGILFNKDEPGNSLSGLLSS